MPSNDRPPSILSTASVDSLPSTTTSTISTPSSAVFRARLLSFAAAVFTSLCAGSITVFSLYGHIFQERLHYTQLQVNGVAIGSSVALYLPVSVLGYICDRHGTVPLSLLSAGLFGAGYGLAAVVYRYVDAVAQSRDDGGSGPAWSYGLMVLAFVSIGIGTCAMYLSAVATCAKNFGKGRHRGLALSSPIAGFGLSGIWLSQVGSHFFSTESRGIMLPAKLDVYHYFLFLGALLLCVGIAGAFTLRIIDEDEMIEDAAEELERSGLLEPPLLSREPPSTYGSFHSEMNTESGASANFPTDLKDRKTWVLNAETRSFLQDRTMWAFAIGFLLIIGPGEAFINNLGTVLTSLAPAPGAFFGALFSGTDPATHVSILSITSTAARLLTGSLTDLLAPTPTAAHIQLETSGHLLLPPPPRRTISRISFLLFFALLLSLGLAFLASGLLQDHPASFWLVTALVGSGYGAVFSLTPIIITIIWGVENFATNWGIVAMLPAVGSTFWGVVYSKVYEGGAEDGSLFCYGVKCYGRTFWGMAGTVWGACGLILWAWKGRGGWVERGIVI